LLNELKAMDAIHLLVVVLVDQSLGTEHKVPDRADNLQVEQPALDIEDNQLVEQSLQCVDIPHKVYKLRLGAFHNLRFGKLVVAEVDIRHIPGRDGK
jgi:hypothetical protein